MSIMRSLQMITGDKNIPEDVRNQAKDAAAYINNLPAQDLSVDVIEELGFYPSQGVNGNVITGEFEWSFTLDGSALTLGQFIVPDLRNPNPGATAPIQAGGGMRSGNFYPQKRINTTVTDLRAMFLPGAVLGFEVDLTGATVDVEQLRNILAHCELYHAWQDGDRVVSYALPLASVAQSQFNAGIAAGVNPAASFREGTRLQLDKNGKPWSGDPVWLSTGGTDVFAIVCNQAVAALTAAGTIQVKLSMYGSLIPNVNSPELYRQGSRCSNGEKRIGNIRSFLSGLMRRRYVNPTVNGSTRVLNLLGK